jgi:hypothetical protein
MDVSKDDWRGWYDAGADGKWKIIVVGKVTEANGSTTTLVRTEPQCINSRMLMLKIHIEPYPGQFHPHIAFEREIRYEEPVEKGAFTNVHIESNIGDFSFKVEGVPK